MIAEGSDVKWFDLSLLEEKEETIPESMPTERNTPRVNLFRDDDSVSTFLNQINVNLTLSVFQDDMTQNTMDSRLNVVERSVNSLQHGMHEKFDEILQAMQTHGNISTPSRSVLPNSGLDDPNNGGINDSAEDKSSSAHRL